MGTGELWYMVGVQIKQDGAVEEHGPELEQWVEGEGGHVRLGPAFSTLL